ncbi:MAG: AMP-binding protein, partial [Candidatus Binatia bacterium]
MAEPITGPSLPWLWERARRNSEAPALRCEGQEITFGALALRGEEVARRLTALGVRRGERIVLIMDTSVRSVELVHAAQRLGVTLVPLNARLTATEVIELLADAQPSIVLHDEPHA